VEFELRRVLSVSCIVVLDASLFFFALILLMSCIVITYEFGVRVISFYPWLLLVFLYRITFERTIAFISRICTYDICIQFLSLRHGGPGRALWMDGS
jgi:hypothetical protein